MKKAKLLVAIAALLAVGSAAFATKSKILVTFYKAAIPGGACSVPTTIAGTTINNGRVLTIMQVTIIRITISCPTQTIYITL
ncbi:hypothetical protein ACE38W_01880 [Chitinophaga sp. Hz27]|uniref:hypothetical protein n=1 Tax=Chitinophaga sp. Hz27 TaxID=3347169 RepID=UPI0035DE7DFE